MCSATAPLLRDLLTYPQTKGNALTADERESPWS